MMHCKPSEQSYTLPSREHLLHEPIGEYNFDHTIFYFTGIENLRNTSSFGANQVQYSTELLFYPTRTDLSLRAFIPLHARFGWGEKKTLYSSPHRESWRN